VRVRSVFKILIGAVCDAYLHELLFLGGRPRLTLNANVRIVGLRPNLVLAEPRENFPREMLSGLQFSSVNRVFSRIEYIRRQFI
jgi:hypothetical protein